MVKNLFLLQNNKKNKLNNTNYDLDLSDDVIKFKNINTTLVLLDIMRQLK